MTFVSALDWYFNNIESYSVDKTKGIKFSVVCFYDPEHAMLFNQAVNQHLEHHFGMSLIHDWSRAIY